MVPSLVRDLKQLILPFLFQLSMCKVELRPSPCTSGAEGRLLKAKKIEAEYNLIISYSPLTRGCFLYPFITCGESMSLSRRNFTGQVLRWGLIFTLLIFADSLFIPASRAVPNDLTLTLLSSSEPDSPGNNVMIGEVASYSLVYEVPEGTSANVVVTAVLPAGLQYVATATSTVSNNGGWTAPMTVGGGGSSGADITFSFGTINNTDVDANIETITIGFRAIVNNVVANQAGTALTLNCQLRINGTLTTTSANVTLTVVEPNLTITNTVQDFTGLIATANPLTDAGDEYRYIITITNTGNVRAYDLSLSVTIPLTYVSEPASALTSTGIPAPNTINGFDPIVVGWEYLEAGQSVSFRIRMSVDNTVEPRDSWSSTATLVYASLPDENGTNNDVPGAYGTATGARNGADGAGGALNDYAPSPVTSPTLSVPEVAVNKQAEHPLSPVVATSVFPAGYSDSTNDANTGTSQHDTAEPSGSPEADVDIAIGETFNYIVTVTFPEGTTDNFTLLDVSYPSALSGGRQNRFIELLNAQVIYVGANLSGVGLRSVGTTFTALDTSNGDGDGDQLEILGTGARTVLNTPDNVTDDADRYVIRVTARLDDEDASGGAADDIAGVANSNSLYAGNRAQISWTDNIGTRSFSVVEDIDIVEPTLTLTKTASVSIANQGDTVVFTLTLTNTGTAPAYDVVFTDTLPFLGATNYFTFSSINTASSTCDNRVGYSATTGTPISTFDFDNLLAGESCTLVINAVVQNNTTFNTTYTNNASITGYSSRPGTATDDRTTYTAVNASANVQVIDRITITFDSATSSSAEATGIGNVLRVTTASGGATSAAATVTIGVAGGGTATAADYTLGGTITIPVGTANNSLVSIASGFSVNNDAIVEPDETVNLQLSAPSANAVLGAQTTHTHTIQNDDTTTLTIGDNNIVEGNAGTSTLNLTVTSSAAVQGGFTVAYSLTDGTATIANNDYAATGSSLTFTGTAGETRTIPVTINGDLNIEANETFTASLGAISGTTIPVANFVRSDTGIGTINNDDTAAINVTPITIAIAEGGATATFNVSAQVNPAATVSIPVTTDAQCTVSVNPVVLAAGNTTAVTVTVTAVDDLDIEGAHTCVITLGDPTSGDANFDALTAANTADVTANITDNDVASITVTPLTIAIAEGGTTADFSVSAQVNPAAAVSIPVTTDGQCTVSANPVVLAAGGITPVTVTVTAVDDLDIEGAHTCVITLGDPTSGDANFDALTAANTDDVTASVTDNDSAGIIVSPLTIAIAEGGATADFDLSSSTNTAATVDIPVATDGQCLISSAANPVPSTTLTATLPIGSGTAITITVEAVDDNIAEGAHTCVITTGDPISADANYNTLGAVDAADVTADVGDNDTASITLTTITITEGAAGVAMDVTLSSEPTGDVTVNLTADAQCTLSTAALTFTNSAGASPWNVAQQVTITAVDDLIAEGAHVCVITYTATSSDANYTIAATNQNVDVVDNDNAGITLEAITITEGAPGLDMDVLLTSEPTGDVTVNLTADAQCTLSTAALTFTNSAGANPWNAAQQVTVTAVDDLVAEGAHVCVITYTATSADANYTIAATNQNADVIDNDTPGVSLTTITITEGAAGVDMDVVLFSEPTGDVTVNLTADAQCTLSTAALTFTNSAGANPWNVAQQVTVTAVDDLIAEGAHVCVITYTATSADANYTIAATDHTIDVVDNDTPGIFLANVSVGEGRTGLPMNVVLFTEPTGDVTITLTPDAQCRLSITTLTFTDNAGATPWNVAQPIIVTAIDDDIDEADRHRCVLAVSSTSADANYDALALQHRVVVRDNDGDDDDDESSAPAIPAETFLCSNLSQQTNGAMTGSGMVGNVELNGVYGNTYCTVLTLNGEFRRSPAEIGNAFILEQGVVQALDVYGLLPDGVSVVPFLTPVQICFTGSGSMYFLSSFGGSPPPVLLPLLPNSSAGYSCVSVPNAGKIILVGMPSLLPPPQAQVTSTMLAQGACQVTTTFAVRLRATPDASSSANVMTTLPFDITLVATEYVPGWYRVIYLDGQGWVSEEYLSTAGAC